jgi:hypothetical protein
VEIDAAARAGRDRKADDEDASDADSDAEERRVDRAGSRWLWWHDSVVCLS